MSNKTASQFIKYSVVGVANTLITLISIWICSSVLGLSDYISNPIGYILGLTNSFILNKNWTFEQKNNAHIIHIGLRFILIFAVSYIIQYGCLILLLYRYPELGFVNQIGSMIVYTLINFTLNKHFTFINNKNDKNA